MEAREKAARAEGAFLAVQKLIDELDLEEPGDFNLEPILSVNKLMEV